MSEIRLVKCDRCGTQVDLIGPDGDRPNGWTFLKDRDLCSSCHTEYKAQFAQMQDLFFKNAESPVMKLIVAGRRLVAGTVAVTGEWKALRDALDEIDPPKPVF